MPTSPAELSAKLRQLAAELRQMETRLQAAPAAETASLQEFRQALDNTRLTAWSVNEMMNTRNRASDGDSVLSFLAAERLRRFDQLARSMCADLDRQAISLNTQGMQSLRDSVNALQSRLKALFGK
ncbi:MAG: hypothetical protein ACRD4F_10305 [Candidatus Angelobacter sp.]